MRSRTGFRLLLLLVFILGVVLIAFLIYQKRVGSVQYVTITYAHSHNATIYNTSQSQDTDNSDNVPVAEITSSGQKVKLKKGVSYVLAAKGDSGFEDKKVGFVLGNSEREIFINPYYSAAKLASLANDELASINQALVTTYPNSNSYDIQTGKLYHWGDWYGTVLKYKGTSETDSDPLRVVLAKENGQWIVKSNPPYITLSRFIYPGIPVDVLDDVNNAARFQIKVSAPPAGGAHFRQR